MNRKEDYDSYEIEEPSDEERASSSSEDELDILLNGTPEQKKKLLREYLTGESESSSCDEFEKEMEAELTTTMNSIEGNWAAPLGQAGVSTGTSGGSDPSGTQPQQVYDSIYFDSDSDSDQEGKAGSSKSQRKKQHVIPTNDELLYDPDEDDRDQAWADAKRRRYSRCQATVGRNRMRSQALPSSDAVLNCPSCMTTLCLDCQRHEKYRTQYRAMFVMNCDVNKEEILRYKAPQKKQKQTRKKRKHDQTDTEPEAAQPGTTDSRLGGMDEDEIYHPVLCTECSTEVAVYDKDEVYHFFNILASHS
ncbi:hypothetical protein AALO_G00244130 [Alosa alosa]|uniref:E2F-associated phosphoprotein n=1 Tax=Alosa alosa TaxID=278164 RepID=A0AAV6FWF0_9TELE|nr:E2F-associated phosphoprotein [Alosa sapidissima]XP_048083568.1 E2F-associated phosphoprotein [Alosa alosa]KAG5265587.1 hypothetical protein AALO_G00244130 [Alosa alosa]